MKEELKEHSNTILSSTGTDTVKVDEIIDDGLRRVNVQLLTHARHENPGINEFAEHVLRSIGKRVRSRFVLTSYLVFNDHLDQIAIDIATAVELFHTATLLHDDVLDEAKLRRGQETVNSKWGSRTAVLLGDYLLSRTFFLLEKTGSMEIMSRFIETAQRLGEGALTEQIHKDDLTLTEDTYYYIISRKTAAFFGLCASMGAYLSSADEKDMNLLRDYGLNFGMAFQITDDLMDVVSDESTMGKPRGKDILEGHLTLPLIRYFTTNEINLDGKKLSELTPDDDKFQSLLEGINSDGSLSYSYEKASEYIKRALISLDGLPKNEATAVFRQMSSELIKRKA